MKSSWIRLTPEKVIPLEQYEQNQAPGLPPEPIPATRSLGTNLQRAVDAYNRRAEALTAQIDAATSEREDVLKARDAAALALEALVGGVMEAAVAEELG